MAFDTGNGTTVALTTGPFTASVISVTIGEQTIDMLDASHLGTTGFMEKVVSDLADAGEVTIEYLADSTDEDKFKAPLGQTDTLTITLPEQVAAGNPPTFAGTGAVTTWKPPDLVNGQLQTGSFTFTWDGYTGPTFTEDAAA